MPLKLRQAPWWAGKTPVYYYLQINLCLECANREWCDFISWTPSAYKVIRVTRDRALHESLRLHYRKFFDAMCTGDGPPPVRKGEIQEIRETVEDSRAVHMDVGLWNWFEPGQVPERDD